MSGETRAKAELALMGIVIVPDTNEEAVEIFEYVLKTLNVEHITGAEVLKNAYKYSSKKVNTVHGICINTLKIGYDSMRCITIIEEAKKCLDTRMGIYCWVENLDAPDCSELGCCFFKKNDQGLFKRIS